MTEISFSRLHAWLTRKFLLKEKKQLKVLLPMDFWSLFVLTLSSHSNTDAARKKKCQGFFLQIWKLLSIILQIECVISNRKLYSFYQEPLPKLNVRLDLLHIFYPHFCAEDKRILFLFALLPAGSNKKRLKEEEERTNLNNSEWWSDKKPTLFWQSEERIKIL